MPIVIHLTLRKDNILLFLKSLYMLTKKLSLVKSSLLLARVPSLHRGEKKKKEVYESYSLNSIALCF